MPEEHVSGSSTAADAPVWRADGMVDQMKQITRLRRFVIAFAVVGLVSVGLLLTVLLRSRAWQMVVPAGATAGSCRDRSWSDWNRSWG